ncbi:hypothetical protein AAG747_24985 [Rapidithrix thailandica]|uniref:Uncharacterized protein n=1 Tax=Rapidithrix thailandica TaxID=413964 RepID=A0AAW9SCR3_9BACT
MKTEKLYFFCITMLVIAGVTVWSYYLSPTAPEPPVEEMVGEDYAKLYFDPVHVVSNQQIASSLAAKGQLFTYRPAKKSPLDKQAPVYAHLEKANQQTPAKSQFDELFGKGLITKLNFLYHDTLLCPSGKRLVLQPARNTLAKASKVELLEPKDELGLAQTNYLKEHAFLEVAKDLYIKIWEGDQPLALSLDNIRILPNAPQATSPAAFSVDQQEE